MNRKPLRVVRNQPFDAKAMVKAFFDEIGDEDPEQFMENKEEKLVKFMGDYAVKKGLNAHQIQSFFLEVQAALQRLSDFDPEPYVQELYVLWQEKQLKQDDDSQFNIDQFAEEKNLNKLEKGFVLEAFHEYMRKVAGKNLRRLTIPMFFIFGSAVALAIYTPNLLQKIGILPDSAGWTIKIILGLLFLWIYFKIAKSLFSLVIDRLYKDLTTLKS